MASSTVPTSVRQVPCPRCREPLIDPKGLGWCKACGYCQSLADSEKKVVVETTKPAIPTHVPGAQTRVSTRWIWATLLGVVLIAGATYGGARFLPLGPLERALLTTLQIGAGLLIMFIGQLIGLLRIAPEDPTLSFKDAVFPFRLYGLVFKRLPKAAVTIYGGAWGLAAIVAAVVFVGGLEHWFNYLPGNKNRPNQVQKSKSVR